MANTDDLRSLSVNTAETLLTAIGSAAPSANHADLKELAAAYAAVTASMPKRDGRGGLLEKTKHD